MLGSSATTIGTSAFGAQDLDEKSRDRRRAGDRDRVARAQAGARVERVRGRDVTADGGGGGQRQLEPVGELDRPAREHADARI